MDSITHIPDESTVASFLQSHFSESIKSVTRFSTGLCHHVFEVYTASGKAYVARIASVASVPALIGGLYWHPCLVELGIPVPKLIASSTVGQHPFMLLERLPGADLGYVYKDLSASVKKDIAEQVVKIQKLVSKLRTPTKFGFANSIEHIEKSGKKSWTEVVYENIERSENRMIRTGMLNMNYVQRVRTMIAKHDYYLRAVRPVPFLDDSTTKNVIVNNDQISGIVDTDQVCFGDPLFTIGLTKMALLSLEAEEDYIEYWLDAIAAESEERKIVDLYSLVFCLCFMSELGQTFNQVVEYEEAKAESLRGIFEQIINNCLSK